MANNKVWTPDKEDFLVENFLLMTDRQLAEALQCAESTVNKKVKDMGLYRPSAYKSPKHHLMRLLDRWDKELKEKEVDFSAVYQLRKRCGKVNKGLKLRGPKPSPTQ